MKIYILETLQKDYLLFYLSIASMLIALLLIFILVKKNKTIYMSIPICLIILSVGLSALFITQYKEENKQEEFFLTKINKHKDMSSVELATQDSNMSKAVTYKVVSGFKMNTLNRVTYFYIEERGNSKNNKVIKATGQEIAKYIIEHEYIELNESLEIN